MLSRPETILTSASIDQHQTFLSARNLSSNTRRGYKADLTEYLLWRNRTGLTPPTKLDEQECFIDWVRWSGETLAPATQRRRKAAVTSYTRFARGYEAGFLDDLRMVPAVPRRPHPLPGLDATLVKMVVMAWADGQFELAALVSAGGYVGCRVSESLSLVPSSFLLDTMEVQIRGKGNKIRFVPLSKSAWTSLQPAYDLALQFKMNYGYERPLINIEERAARRLITQLGERLGLDRSVSSHDLRSTFATMTYKNVQDILVVMRLMGHARSEDTEPYIQEDELLRRKAVEY